MPYIIRYKRKQITAQQIIDLMTPIMAGVHHEIAHIADPVLNSLASGYQFEHRDLVGRVLKFFANARIEASPRLREHNGQPILVDAAFIRKFSKDMNSCISMIIDRRTYTMSLSNLFILGKDKAFLVELEEQYRTEKSKVHDVGLHMATAIALEILKFMDSASDVWLYDETNSEQADISHFSTYLKEKDRFYVSVLQTDMLRSIVITINAMNLDKFILDYNGACDGFGIEPGHRIINVGQYRELERIRRSR